MKKLIKTTIMASALFTSSLMAATAYESDIMHHPVEGIMNYGVAESMVTSQRVDIDQSDIMHHPVEGIMNYGVAESMVTSQRVDIDQSDIMHHPVEGIMNYGVHRVL